MKIFRSGLLLEAGAALFFFGVLATMPGLQEAGSRALKDLAALGYRVPDASNPVRVYPAGKDSGFSFHHAGGWRSGVIVLRENPLGAAGPEVMLRHELMHEANSRTCGGKLPLWAEEASAMRFSGELAFVEPGETPPEASIRRLAERVRVGAPLNPEGTLTLARLVALHGWPDEPCRISPAIERLLTPAPARTGGTPGTFSCLLMSLVSGRVLDAEGDQESVYPPGSLLKLPYAAALGAGDAQTVGAELARSDAEALAARHGALDETKYRLLLSAASPGSPERVNAAAESEGWNASKARVLLGERGADGLFPFESDLPGLARMVRASLLMAPERFTGLARNGVDAGTTLAGAPEEALAVLRRLKALAKTGTVSDERGNPVAGHLAVAWPAESPVYLALFRTLGGTGASNLGRAAEKLADWSRRYPAEAGVVRVSLMTLLSESSWEVLDETPSFDRIAADGTTLRVSLNGTFRILSSARGARDERLVFGCVERRRGREGAVLETDPESYADAVLDAEAADLSGEAARALRAVIVWNGVHGGVRHPETGAICDTTHCMVFPGSMEVENRPVRTATDAVLLGVLDGMARDKGLDWLPFSAGGTDRWVKEVAVSDLKRAVSEPAVLDLRRERSRGGEVVVHLLYRESEETVPCEVFRNRLKLLSCPESIRLDEGRSVWVFEGIGKGHGLGLSVERARGLADAGWSARGILADAYR